MQAASGRVLLREIPFNDVSSCSPQFADGHASLVFELGRTCGERWLEDSTRVGGTVTGPMTRVGRTTSGTFPEMIGILFGPAGASPFLHVAMTDLVDRTVLVDEIWGKRGAQLTDELSELDETARLDRLEVALLRRLAVRTGRSRSVDVRGLAFRILESRGRVAIEDLARAAGVSRQHLTREFRDQMGVAPKLYSRLARFQSGLRYSGCRTVDWAVAAIEMGYADQSHLIAEFRQFSGLTPRELAERDWFHPFIERAEQSDVDSVVTKRG
jgi:AraC-like DNA-binding protein